MKNCDFLVSFILLLLTFFSCKKEEPGKTVLFDFTQVPFTTLSEYNFFIGDLKDLNPSNVLMPYELKINLFSNYAEKQRLIYFPKNGKATYLNDKQKTLDFDEGTIIIKTFYYLTDLRDNNSEKNILETRLLVRKNNKWNAHSYYWNDEKTEAELKDAGKSLNVSWIHLDGSERETLYSIPNKNECKGCHELGTELVLIGPKARYLNTNFNYHDGEMNQLEKWESLGLLENLPSFESRPKGVDYNENFTLDEQARTYLDINCAHCHNAEGPANNTGMFLDFEQTDSIKLGICKSPVAAGSGSGGLNYAITPGNAQTSILINRLNSLELDVSMPELGRSVIHEEGLQLLTDWINNLEGTCD